MTEKHTAALIWIALIVLAFLGTHVTVFVLTQP